MTTVISVENLSKTYHLGQIGTGTFTNDLKVWWAKSRGKPNPLLRIGETDHGNRDGEELWALKDVSFTVGQGEVLGIIGRNGAGKSTLLKILSRVTAPTSGQVKVKGRIASLLEVGTGFHPELTGRENIYLNGALLGMNRREIDRKFDEIADFSGVEKFIDTPVKRYSSGMYVRLAFAVAAHLESEILLVDEVLAVGDAAFQKKSLGKMSEVAGQGRTVLFVSHDMTAISNLCETAYLFENGALSSIGNSQDVIVQYMQKEPLRYLGGEKVANNERSNIGAVFTGVSFRDKKHQKVEFIQVGAPLLIDLDYEFAPEDDRLLNVSVSIVLSDQLGINLVCLWSDVVGANFASIPQKGKLVCKIPEVLLAPGLYHLRLAITSNGTLLDKVQQAAVLRVTESDFFNTGKLPPARLGKLLLPHEWFVAEKEG
ncbi:MAG: ABC transporter ATP-binding protein [Chloroflexota bacterium]